MAPACLHGLDPSECLICRTLGTGPDPAVATKAAPAAGGWSSLGRSPPPEPVRPDVVYRPGSPGHRPRSLGLHLALLVAAVVVIGLAVWVVAGALLAILHVVELVVVAGVAAWAGYRLGHYRGSRSQRGD